jgi:hypothetical protein
MHKQGSQAWCPAGPPNAACAWNQDASLWPHLGLPRTAPSHAACLFLPTQVTHVTPASCIQQEIHATRHTHRHRPPARLLQTGPTATVLAHTSRYAAQHEQQAARCQQHPGAGRARDSPPRAFIAHRHHRRRRQQPVSQAVFHLGPLPAAISHIGHLAHPGVGTERRH